jgi:DNA-binding transcriptional ArsR family regulator
VTALTDTQLTDITQIFRLLGDPTRLRIVLACVSGPIAVADIAQTITASQSLVSHHLRLLRSARLVRGTRRNKQVFYELADAHVADMLSGMIEHVAEDHPDHGEPSET